MRQMRTSSRDGMAILSVMFIIITVAFIAAQLLSNYQRTMKQTIASVQFQHVTNYVFLAEMIGKQRLLQTYPQYNEFIGMSPDWMEPQISKIDGVTYTCGMNDLQSKLNINMLAVLNSDEHDELAGTIFQSFNLPITLLPVLYDWLDADNTTREQGAESDLYLMQNPPYHAANRAVADISELRLLAGMSNDLYHDLQLFLTALPTDTGFNINALPETFKRALLQQFSSVTSEPLQRGTKITRENISAMFGDNAPVATESHYFSHQCKIETNNMQIIVKSMLFYPQDAETPEDILTYKRAFVSVEMPDYAR